MYRNLMSKVRNSRRTFRLWDKTPATECLPYRQSKGSNRKPFCKLVVVYPLLAFWEHDLDAIWSLLRAGETRKAFVDSKNTLPSVFTQEISFFKTSRKEQIERFMRVLPAEKGSSCSKTTLRKLTKCMCVQVASYSARKD